MRYALAMLLALGIGITAAAPAALASPGLGTIGPACYRNGVAYSCVPPFAPVTLDTRPSGRIVAGSTTSQPMWIQYRLENLGQ